MSLGSKATLGANYVSLEEPDSHKVFTFNKV